MAQRDKTLLVDRHSTWGKYAKIRSGILCIVCDLIPMTLTSSTYGHILSVAEGGKNQITNAAPVCAGCNTSMQSTDMRVYLIAKENWAGLARLNGDLPATTYSLNIGEDEILLAANALKADRDACQLDEKLAANADKLAAAAKQRYDAIIERTKLSALTAAAVVVASTQNTDGTSAKVAAVEAATLEVVAKAAAAEIKRIQDAKDDIELQAAITKKKSKEADAKVAAADALVAKAVGKRVAAETAAAVATSMPRVLSSEKAINAAAKDIKKRADALTKADSKVRAAEAKRADAAVKAKCAEAIALACRQQAADTKTYAPPASAAIAVDTDSGSDISESADTSATVDIDELPDDPAKDGNVWCDACKQSLLRARGSAHLVSAKHARKAALMLPADPAMPGNVWCKACNQSLSKSRSKVHLDSAKHATAVAKSAEGAPPDYDSP